MKIVADENGDKQIVDRLRTDGHDVLYVAELDPGIDDETVLGKSRHTNAILLTADKDSECFSSVSVSFTAEYCFSASRVSILTSKPTW